MKYLKLLFIIFFFFYFEKIIQAEQNKIIIKIDNEIITSQDVKNRIITTLLLSKKKITQQNIDSLKKRTIEDLIQLTIKKIALENVNFEKDIQRINSYLNSISGNNIQNLKESFKKNNIDFQVLLDEIDTELKWRKFIYQNFEKKIQINTDEIDEEIKNIKKNNKDFIEYNLSEIEVSINNENSESVIINRIISEINKNGFENAVIKFSTSITASDKGNLGWVNSNSLSDEFTEILEIMKIGDISKPIKKQNKIVFLKLNDKKISNLVEASDESLKKKIIDQKKNELFKLYSNSFLSQLRNTKYIEYF